MTDPSARHGRRARTALAHLAEIDPAIAALALWCGHRDDPGPTRTMGETIRYGPDFEALSLPEQVGLAAHHILHVALRHSPRAGAMAGRLGDGFDAALFNLAADGLVNDTLLAAGHALPRPAVQARALLSAAGETGADIATLLAGWDAERLYFALARRPDGRDGARAEGDRQGFEPDLEADPTGGGGGADEAASVWHGRLAQALAAGKRAGTGIGALGAPLADLPAARVPWERRLRARLARAFAEVPRRAHDRPAGRWIAAEDAARRTGGPVPAFEPGLRRNRRIARIVICLDMSSSVDDAQLTLFAAEAAGIAARTGARIHLLSFDTEVHQRLDPPPGGLRAALATLFVAREGGTDFAPVLAEAARLDPGLIVVLSDLEGPVGDAPAAPVVWAVPDAAHPPAPFGEVLVMAG